MTEGPPSWRTLLLDQGVVSTELAPARVGREDFGRHIGHTRRSPSRRPQRVRNTENTARSPRVRRCPGGTHARSGRSVGPMLSGRCHRQSCGPCTRHRGIAGDTREPDRVSSTGLVLGALSGHGSGSLRLSLSLVGVPQHRERLARGSHPIPGGGSPFCSPCRGHQHRAVSQSRRRVQWQTTDL